MLCRVGSARGVCEILAVWAPAVRRGGRTGSVPTDCGCFADPSQIGGGVSGLLRCRSRRAGTPLCAWAREGDAPVVCGGSRLTCWCFHVLLFGHIRRSCNVCAVPEGRYMWWRLDSGMCGRGHVEVTLLLSSVAVLVSHVLVGVFTFSWHFYPYNLNCKRWVLL